jgi:hypothetical protein
MNRFILLLACCFVIALAALPAGAQNSKAHGSAVQQTAMDYHQYQSYFEKNNSRLKGRVSYLAITTQAQFDKIFGAAATGGDNDFLPEGVFKNKMVVAAIMRGNSIREYKVKDVTSDKGTLTISYDTEDRVQAGASFSSPLIVTVDKGKYRQVVFMENGKRAGSVRLKK